MQRTHNLDRHCISYLQVRYHHLHAGERRIRRSLSTCAGCTASLASHSHTLESSNLYITYTLRGVNRRI